MPARAAVVPEIVPRELMVNAMALQSATYSMSRVAGPALAGWLIAWFAAGDNTSATGVGIVLYVIAAMYLASVVATALLSYQGVPKLRPDATMVADIAEGFRYMGRERLILGLLIMGTVPMMFGFAPSFLAPVFNKRDSRRQPANPRLPDDRYGCRFARRFPRSRSSGRHRGQGKGDVRGGATSGRSASSATRSPPP